MPLTAPPVRAVSPDPKARKGRKRAKALSGEGDAVCLARATDGKVKLSCEISAKDHIKFQIAYSDMLKLELDGLKKRRVPGPASRRAAPPAGPRTRAGAPRSTIRPRPQPGALTAALCARRDRKREKELKSSHRKMND